MKKGFFDMTRRERRGTIVLLALIVVLLLVTAVVKLRTFPPQAGKEKAPIQTFFAQET